MHLWAVAGLVLVGIGALLILVGAWMSVVEWKKTLEGKTDAERQSLEGALKGLAKLAEALKSYPHGQRMIVWGIVVVIVGGIIGGVSGL